MTKSLTIYLFAAIAFILFTTTDAAAFNGGTTTPENTISTLSLEDITTLDKKGMEAKMGRKLKFKERLMFSVLKRTLKKGKKRQARAKAKKSKDEGKQVSGLAIASVILGGLALFLLLLGFVGIANVAFIGLLLAIPGLITGIIGLKKVNKNPETLKGSGMAIAGLSMSATVIFVMILLFALVVSIFAAI